MRAQRDQPGGRNRPAGKDRTPLLLRCLASQHSDLREALMVSHNVAVGVYARGSIVLFSGLMNLGRHWRAEPYGPTGKGLKTPSALCARPAFACRIDSAGTDGAGNGAEVGSQWSERRRWDSSGPKSCEPAGAFDRHNLNVT